jgi:hypothetical protein
MLHRYLVMEVLEATEVMVEVVVQVLPEVQEVLPVLVLLEVRVTQEVLLGMHQMKRLLL